MSMMNGLANLLQYLWPLAGLLLAVGGLLVYSRMRTGPTRLIMAGAIIIAFSRGLQLTGRLLREHIGSLGNNMWFLTSILDVLGQILVAVGLILFAANVAVWQRPNDDF